MFLYLSVLIVELNKSSVLFFKYDGKGMYFVVMDFCLNLWFFNVFIVFNLLFYKML